MPWGCLPGRLSYWFSCWFLPGPCGRRREDRNCLRLLKLGLLKTEKQSEVRPSPAYQRYTQSKAHDCCYPQRWHIERSQPCNVCRKSILSRLHTNPPDPEGHASEAQHDADPLLDNNRLGRSALLFILFLLPHPPSGTRSARMVSHISVKTAGAAVEDLNRISAFGRQCSACA
jgi:hypothetical protein